MAKSSKSNTRKPARRKAPPSPEQAVAAPPWLVPYARSRLDLAPPLKKAKSSKPDADIGRALDRSLAAEIFGRWAPKKEPKQVTGGRLLAVVRDVAVELFGRVPIPENIPNGKALKRLGDELARRKITASPTTQLRAIGRRR